MHCLIQRFPVDIEVMSITARVSITEYVNPPRVLFAHSHVIWNNIDNYTEPRLPQCRNESFKCWLPPELRVDLSRVDHIIAVYRARLCSHNGRCVEMTHMKRRQVGHDF